MYLCPDVSPPRYSNKRSHVDSVLLCVVDLHPSLSEEKQVKGQRTELEHGWSGWTTHQFTCACGRANFEVTFEVSSQFFFHFFLIFLLFLFNLPSFLFYGFVCFPCSLCVFAFLPFESSEEFMSDFYGPASFCPMAPQIWPIPEQITWCNKWINK